MAKKKEEDIRERFIKIMLTNDEFKQIDRYAKLQFQTKSDFVRLAIRDKIFEISNSIMPKNTDRRFKQGRLRRDIKKELVPVIKEHENGEFLEKPDERELKARQKMLDDRKKELEEELERIEQTLKKQ